jgi:raffinose/stachyose/melibiose transport system permease protein
MTLTDVDRIASAATANPPSAPRERRRNGRRAAIFFGIIAYLVTFLIILPLLWIALLSLQPSEKILSNPFSFDDLTLENYLNAANALPLLQMYGNTIFIALVSVTVGTAISFMGAFSPPRGSTSWRDLPSRCTSFCFRSIGSTSPSVSSGPMPR